MRDKIGIKTIAYMVIGVMLMTLVSPQLKGEVQVAHAESKPTYRVLEIQPTNNYQGMFDNGIMSGGSVYENWSDFLSIDLKKTGANVQVSRMTSVEFNGRQEDLVTNYDLIYIGVKSNQWDMTGWGEYWNSNSVGRYNHMGGTTNITEAISNKGEVTQGSGEDITADKKEELLDFAKAGGAIFVSEYVYAFDASYGRDSLRIDPQSNMHDLLYNKLKIKRNTSSDEFKNVISCNIYNKISNDMKKKLGDAITSMEVKCSLNLTEQPVHNDYINKEDLNNRELRFAFNISDSLANPDTTRYQVDFYIDLNSDGKYDNSESMNRYMQVRAKTGGSLKPNELKAGTEYILTRDIGDYVGIIYWKLRITKIEGGVATTVKDEIIDYCKVQPKLLVDGKEEIVKKNIKVLQIMADEGTGNGGGRENSVWLPTKEEVEYLEANYASLVNNQTEEAIVQAAKEIRTNKSKLFDLYDTKTKIKEEYLTVTLKFWLYTRNLDEFKITIERIPVPNFEEMARKATVNVDNYDMLILGFADCYTDITEEKALKAIDGFIKDGKTILFTHDTTSFVNEDPYTGTSTGWGYNINRYFRNMLGMDRYGVNDKVYEYNEADKTEKDYVWNKQNAYMDYSQRAQGFTDYLMDSIQGQRFDYKMTQTVTAVNTGQILTYPYAIPENAQVATTHGQYYQLDLEADDIVVWYCLSGGAYNYYDKKNSQGVLRKDARNNYYIYNRKNITYSGAGHDGHLTNDEIKLFINTMVSAYRASSSAVSIEITNPEASRDKADNTFFYISYLKSNPKQPIGSNIVSVGGKPAKRVSFYLTKNAVNSKDKMTLKFGDITTIYDEKGKVVKELQDDTPYYVDVPLTELEGNETMSRDAELTITYRDDTGGTTVKTVKKKIVFMRRTMFNLN